MTAGRTEPTEPASGTVATRRLGDLVLRLGLLVALAAAWQLLALVADDPVLWPPFAEIAAHLVDRWLANPAAWVQSLVPSVWRLVAGWGLAVVAGVTIGVLVGLSSRVHDHVAPVVAFLRAIPPPTLLPIFIVLLGIGDQMKVALIAFGVVWPILLNTADGVASVDPLHRETARVYRLGSVNALRRVVLPSAAPQVFAGLRISLSMAVILMVISEMVATVNGVGFELVQAQRSFRTLDVWATILLLGILGFALNAVLGLVERRALCRHAAAWGRAP